MACVLVKLCSRNHLYIYIYIYKQMHTNYIKYLYNYIGIACVHLLVYIKWLQSQCKEGKYQTLLSGLGAWCIMLFQCFVLHCCHHRQGKYMAIQFVSFASWNFSNLYGFTEPLKWLCISKSHKMYINSMTQAQVGDTERDLWSERNLLCSVFCH